MSDADNVFRDEKWKICVVISLEIQKLITQSLAYRLELSLLIDVVNFIMIGVFRGKFWGSGLQSHSPPLTHSKLNLRKP